MINIMWFRSDLRVYDNPALSAAMERGQTIALYFVCRAQWAKHGVGENKQAFILSQLSMLKAELDRLNVPLVVCDAGTFEHIAETAVSWSEEISRIMKAPVAQWWFNAEYEVNEQQLTERVKSVLLSAGIGVQISQDQCLIEPGRVLNGQGGPFKVFSAFKRKVISEYMDEVRPLAPPPQPQSSLAETAALTTLTMPGWESKARRLAELWRAGEDEAHDRLNRFTETAVRKYAEERDLPAREGTSTLSPYLAIGALSVRQCWQAVMQVNGGLAAEGHPGVVTWMNELLWREFYRHLLFFYPKLCKGKAFKPETEALPWRQGGVKFDAWKAGRTGFPIVDAGMRQLMETGWMHNRLRMIVAMFLTKDLFVDWRLGEAYFMEHLIDGDFASNNGGWQWSASTGVDAVPYFRIFNPARQSERFDPSGEFIRRYVPELRAVSGKAIHNPSSAVRTKCGYPEPIVDHAAASALTKGWFSGLNQPFAGAEQGAPEKDAFFRRWA